MCSLLHLNNTILGKISKWNPSLGSVNPAQILELHNIPGSPKLIIVFVIRMYASVSQQKL